MAEKPNSGHVEAAKKGLPSTGPKPVENPAFRMLGLPKFKLKLPSRNWLIFLSITGSLTSAILYDRHHKKRARQRWCNLVSHVAQENLSVKLMPRRITVFLSAPPGDNLRVAREHFHEYIKPILVAGALDWEVVEGRREGDVRAGLAEKIRKLRRTNGEKPPLESSGDSKAEVKEEEENRLQQMRQQSDIDDWHGVQGDLILGRHTWKEYVRGVHEGWLGPLSVPPPETHSDHDPPQLPSNQPTTSQQLPDPLPLSSPDLSSPSQSQDPTSPPSTTTPSTPPSNPSSPAPPYIPTSDYPHSQLPLSSPDSFAPSLPLALPHLLGFLNTPVRFYRFLTQRHLADATGAAVAALVLDTQSRSFTYSIAAATSADTNEASSSRLLNSEAANGERRVWEQEQMLEGEEEEWHKSAWQDVAGTEGTERVWKEKMVVDERIGARMRLFELASEEAERGFREEAEKAKEVGWGVSRWMNELGNWIGIGGEQETPGWEMGLVGTEDD
ncbi:mitochondrial import inner membrane translocase subunit tim54 [Pseudocyphellaria aurata]|nr:mitochondrial import inner membrane translocase subunit tim54 [Pseudocyphellaria aurata]